MSKLKVYEDSKNYTATIVNITSMFGLQGLDNLAGVSVFGNTCIVPKSYEMHKLYVFFPAECVLSNEYLKMNNLYRNANMNADLTTKGYFEDNGRVKAVKFKGNKSTGIVMPVESLGWGLHPDFAKEGTEFNEIDGIEICRKYVVPTKGTGQGTPKQNKLLDEIVDSKLFPQHLDTEHLLKNLDRLHYDDNIVLTIKLHGTSGRVGHTIVKRKLKWHEKLARKFGVKVVEDEYQYVVGSRKVIKSVAFNELKNKQHYYSEDLWTKVAREQFEGKLHPGEIIYFEIIGRDYTGAEIQGGYSYGYTKPTVFIYRITHINHKGFEVDLPWRGVKDRALELGINYVPTLYAGTLYHFAHERGGTVDKREINEWLEFYLKYTYMDKPSIFDSSIYEEGICVRVEKYPTPRIYKMKAPEFLLHEGKMADKLVSDLETQN